MIGGMVSFSTLLTSIAVFTSLCLVCENLTKHNKKHHVSTVQTKMIMSLQSDLEMGILDIVLY